MWQSIYHTVSYLPGNFWSCSGDEHPIKHMGKWAMSWIRENKQTLLFVEFARYLSSTVMYKLHSHSCQHPINVKIGMYWTTSAPRCVLTQVMTEPSDLHTKDVSARDEKFCLPLIQSLYKLSCQVTHPVQAHIKNNLFHKRYTKR